MRPRVTLIGGGLGGARLAPHLAPVCDLTVVADVGDDLEVAGLRVCPDIDSVPYSLAGVFDHERGFGVAGDSLRFSGLAAALDLKGWFQIGDQDLATHVVRTWLLGQGAPLSEATAALGRAMGVRERVLPATDDCLGTVVGDPALSARAVGAQTAPSPRPGSVDQDLEGVVLRGVRDTSQRLAFTSDG